MKVRALPAVVHAIVDPTNAGRMLITQPSGAASTLPLGAFRAQYASTCNDADLPSGSLPLGNRYVQIIGKPPVIDAAPPLAKDARAFWAGHSPAPLDGD